MTPHEREQLLELAEQIVLHLRSRLAGVINTDFPAAETDADALHERLHRNGGTPVLNEKEEPHDQI